MTRRQRSSSVTLTSPALIPRSGVRAAAPSNEEQTVIHRLTFQEPDDETTLAFERSGMVPREPATEPHLVAASPFDEQPAPRESGLRPGPMSETRLDVAPTISRRTFAEHTGLTLCSPGVVRADDVTLPHFPFDREEVTSVAGLPQPLLGFGWLRRLAAAVARAFSRDESVGTGTGTGTGT